MSSLTGKWEGYDPADFRHEGHVTALGSWERKVRVRMPVQASGANTGVLDEEIVAEWKMDDDFTRTRPSFAGTEEGYVFIASKIPEWISIDGTSYSINMHNGKYYIYFNYSVKEIIIDFENNVGGIVAEA